MDFFNVKLPDDFDLASSAVRVGKEVVSIGELAQAHSDWFAAPLNGLQFVTQLFTDGEAWIGDGAGAVRAELEGWGVKGE